MRMSDTLSEYLEKEGSFFTGGVVRPEDYERHESLRKYVPAIKKVSDATGVPASHWRVYEDGNQSSTIAAGKSCCTFLAAVFNSLEQAFAVTVSLRRELPRVNLELFITPDGRRDQGDGVASYDHLGAEFKKRGSYLSPADFGVSVLVDLQNVNRELARNRNYSPGF